MGMDVGSGKGGLRSEINVTPFVDVVLVLLIIFMVLTPLLLKELAVAIPRKADQEVTADLAAQQIVLQLRPNGQMQLGNQPVTLPELASRVREVFASRREKVLFLRIDDAVSYGLAVSVMDICRGAGVQTLGMMTKQ